MLTIPLIAIISLFLTVLFISEITLEIKLAKHSLIRLSGVFFSICFKVKGKKRKRSIRSFGFVFKFLNELTSRSYLTLYTPDVSSLMMLGEDISHIPIVIYPLFKAYFKNRSFSFLAVDAYPKFDVKFSFLLIDLIISLSKSLYYIIKRRISRRRYAGF